MCSFTKIEMSIPVAKKLKKRDINSSQIQYVEASRGIRYVRGKEVEKYPQGVMWAAGVVVQAGCKGGCT